MKPIHSLPVRLPAGGRLAALAAALVLSFGVVSAASAAEVPPVKVLKDASGARLQVGGEDFFVFGMNWGYVPIGTNYNYSLWVQSDDVIKKALDTEMNLLRAMGVNTIRQYTGIPPRWVRYIYENYGIYTVLNHSCARYGYALDGVWDPTVDYANPRLREQVKAEVLATFREFQDTPGILMWLLGNENNYGLVWTGGETEDLPEGERDGARARYLYSMFEEITVGIKEFDDRPVAIANGDIQYLDIIAEECKSLDVFGTNVYRGISVGDLYQRVWDKMGLPVVQTEFGSDAFNAKDMREDQEMQCRYLLGQWQEIYEQSAGKGRVGNSIGGMTFQWSDGWWKFGQTSNLDVHDTNASWANGGYPDDQASPGDNNMNEEWWGITAKGPWKEDGTFEVYPRAAYYALQDACRLDPYGPGTTLEAIRAHFAHVNGAAAMLRARGDRAALIAETASRGQLSGVRVEFETYSTGGERITTPQAPETADGYPRSLGFDRKESYFLEFEGRPSEGVTGNVTLNVLGNVPTNPIDEIFYENRGRTETVNSPDGSLELEGLERVAVYQAGINWDDKWFRLNGFYRTGHYHWGYDGDFFGVYREAFYGENIDIYNGVAPVGVEMEGKRRFRGATLAFGPELWWGANPAVIGKYSRRIGSMDWTGIYQEDIDAAGSQISSTTAIPTPPTRKLTLQTKTSRSTSRGDFGLELGGIWAGNTKVGQTFQLVEEGDPTVYQDEIKDKDTFGWKAKLTWQKGRYNWYAQGAYMGLVADGGPTAALTYTGWGLKDTGSGNQKNFITGIAINVKDFQISPNFLWQKPIVGPIPGDVAEPGRPRNVIDDPFAVRANRETIGTELLITYDPTPATWMWQWDGIYQEDAKFAFSLGFIHRHLPTTMDASIGLLDDGTTSFAFAGATPARDLWEVRLRILSKASRNIRIVSHLAGGTAEPNGDSPRKVKFASADARVVWGRIAAEHGIKFNDFGPYDYHRDFNNTFPLQVLSDVSYAIGTPTWFGVPQTKLGIRTTWRSLDENSPRYGPVLVPGPDGPQYDPGAFLPDGNEWEIRTYLHFVM